jgi:hypothetical protein
MCLLLPAAWFRINCFINADFSYIRYNAKPVFVPSCQLTSQGLRESFYKSLPHSSPEPVISRWFIHPVVFTVYTRLAVELQSSPLLPVKLKTFKENWHKIHFSFDMINFDPLNLKFVKNRLPCTLFLYENCSIRVHWLFPVRIQVRIGPLHPYACRKRRLIGAVLRMRPEKPRSRVTAGVAR